MEAFYNFITSAKDIAQSMLEGLAEAFELIVIENGTLGEFLTAVFPPELDFLGQLVHWIVPIPIIFVVLTGAGFYVGVAIFKWFVGLFK